MKMPKPSEGGNFQRVSEGLHYAVCYQVIDLGTQVVEWQGERKEQRKVQISWEVPEERVEDTGHPCSIHNRYTFSSHEKAKLRHDLESWRGKSFTDEELDPDNPKGFDIRNLLGKACQINVVHNERNGKTYANIASIVPPPKGKQTPDTENEHIYFSMDNPAEFDRDAFNKLPDFLQEIIRKSPQYQQAQHLSAPPPGNTFTHDDEIPF